MEFVSAGAKRMDYFLPILTLTMLAILKRDAQLLDFYLFWTKDQLHGPAVVTTEAEYVAASEATKETVWMRNLLQYIGLEQSAPTVLFCDNQSAIRLVRNPEFHKRTKHIDVQFHFIRENQEDGTIDVQYTQNDQKLADIFTKPLHGPLFQKLRDAIGVGTLRQQNSMSDSVLKA